MPLKRCTVEGDSGWKWGDSGKCYTGEGARARALRQGRAIEANKSDAEREIRVGFFDKLLKNAENDRDRDDMGESEVEKRLHGGDLEYLMGLNDEELDVEFRQMNARLSRLVENAADLADLMRIKGVSPPEETRLFRLLPDEAQKGADADDESAEGAENGVTGPEIPELPARAVKGRGPETAKVAFVGASPSKIDLIRRRPFAGMVGKTINDTYLPPLGLDEADAYFTNVVPVYLEDDNGSPREPTRAEIEKWKPYLAAELSRVNPAAVVALGKTAHSVLGDLADEWVPHPRAINIYGNSGEVERKMARLKKKVGNKVRLVTTKSDERREMRVLKSDEERQIVYGVVMEPLEYDTDANWTDAENIEKAAHFFMEHGEGIDAEHTRAPMDAVVVESYIAPQDLVIGDEPVKKGTWVMGVKVRDDDEWHAVKTEQRMGFSIDATVMIDPTNML